MAVRLNNSAEGGTNGTAITTGANTGGGSGDQFSGSTSGSPTFQFSNTTAAHGSLSYFFSFGASSQNAFLQWQPAGESAGTYAVRGYLYFTAAPAANDQFISALRNAAPATALTIAVSTARRFKVINTAGSTSFTGSVDIPTSTWVRFEYIATKGTGTGDGQVTFKWFLGDSTTAQETFTSTTMNVGTTDFTAARFGRTSALTSTWAFYLDDLAVQTAASGLIGEYGANTPPLVSAGADVIVAATGSAQNVNLTCTASDDGSISGYSWASTLVRSSGTTSAPSIASATSQNTTASVTHPGRYEFTVTVTDDLGATSTATQVVYVTTPTPKVSGLVANPGSWTNQGGAASINAAVADGSDTTSARSPSAPVSEATVRFYLDPAPAFGAMDLTLRDKLVSAGTGVAKVRLIEGVTTRKEWTPTIPGTSLASRTLSLTAGEAATITSALDLQLELSWT